jgi:hypothetical protein
MWTPVSGCQHSRKHLRYGSDLTDAEWGRAEENRSAAAVADARAGECDLLRAALGLPLADGTNFAPHSTV